MTRPDFLKRAEWILAVLLSAAALFFLFVRATHAGALWRDECATVQLAAMPSVSDILRNFQHEAFPPLFPLIVRLYSDVVGPSDAALRVFGFIVGSLVIAAFWINSRISRADVPILGLALISLSTTFFVWGTTIRGYGLGSALIVVMIGCTSSLLIAANRSRAVIALLTCVLAVQVLLYDSILLIAIGTSAMLVLIFQRRFKLMFIVLTIYSIGLLSLLPYLPAYLRAREWNILVRGAPTAYSLWKHFEVALGNPAYSTPAIWYSVAIGLAGVFLFRIYNNHPTAVVGHHMVWFALLVCGLSISGCYAFLRILSYTTSVWYYLALICVLAAALDLIASTLSTAFWLRWFRLGFGVAALIAAPLTNWSAITERQTNVDEAAQMVTAKAASGDLVLVVPWQFGMPFQHYYRGAASWTTIPNITDHRIHRYDLMKAKMVSEHPIDDVRQSIQATLISGNRVWLVGGLNLPSPEEGPMILPPAPASRFKWDNRAYTASWWQQLSVFVVLHATKVDSVQLSRIESVHVNELEQTSLFVAEGWQ